MSRKSLKKNDLAKMIEDLDESLNELNEPFSPGVDQHDFFADFESAELELERLSMLSRAASYENSLLRTSDNTKERENWLDAQRRQDEKLKADEEKALNALLNAEYWKNATQSIPDEESLRAEERKRGLRHARQVKLQRKLQKERMEAEALARIMSHTHAVVGGNTSNCVSWNSAIMDPRTMALVPASLVSAKTRGVSRGTIGGTAASYLGLGKYHELQHRKLQDGNSSNKSQPSFHQGAKRRVSALRGEPQKLPFAYQNQKSQSSYHAEALPSASLAPSVSSSSSVSSMLSSASAFKPSPEALLYFGPDVASRLGSGLRQSGKRGVEWRSMVGGEAPVSSCSSIASGEGDFHTARSVDSQSIGGCIGALEDQSAIGSSSSLQRVASSYRDEPSSNCSAAVQKVPGLGVRSLQRRLKLLAPHAPPISSAASRLLTPKIALPRQMGRLGR